MKADYVIVTPRGTTADTVIEGSLDQGKKIIVISPEKQKEKKDRLSSVKWNPASPLSAKNAALTLENTLDELPPILVFFPDIGASSAQSHQLPYAEIESSVDRALKGMISIIKEIITLIKKNLPGNIILCLPKKPETGNAVIATIYECEKLLGDNLFEEYRDSGCRLFGFQNGYEDKNRFSDYLLHQIPLLTKKAEGKWNVAGEKTSFFSNIKK